MKKEVSWLLKEKYKNKPNKNFKKDVKRLKADEPLDYVIGFTEFLGCKIDLSKKSLIPRPETEFWVEGAINDILTFCRMSECRKNKKRKVLDVFAGSGCIGIAVLKNIKNCVVTFSDKDKKCLEQIKINLKLNNSLIRTNRGIVIESDIFSGLGQQKYDFIFANPPYVSAKNKNKVQKSVLKYEPKNALFGGKDGLFYIKKFLKQAPACLNPGGRIFMEFSPEQKTAIGKLLTRLHCKELRPSARRSRPLARRSRRGKEKYKYKTWQFHKDQFNCWRWVTIG